MYTFSSMKKMRGKNIQNIIFKNSIQIQHVHPVLTYIHTCKLRFSAYRISNSRSIWTNSSYNRTLMAGGRDDICVPPITPPPEVKEPEAGHSPPDDPPPPSTSKGPECPKPGYAKIFWTKEVVPKTQKSRLFTR